MPNESVLYIVYSSVSITISVFIFFLFWERRSSQGAKAMALMMILAAHWSFSDLLSSIATSLITKIFWNRMAFLGPIIIPIIILYFSLQYTKYEKLLTLKNLILISLIPFTTLILLWTNDFHQLFIIEYNTANIGILTIMHPTFGGWFWIHACYSYMLIVISIFLMLKKLATLPQIYRKQAIIMVLAMSNPLVGSALYTFGILPSDPVDPTVFSFTFSGIFFFFGMFRYKLFDLIPVARGAVIETMEDIVVVLDTQNRIIDINTSALNLFGKKTEELIGENIFNLIGDSLPQVLKSIEMLKSSDKVSVCIGASNRHFEIRISPLYDWSSKFIGRFVILHDITEIEAAMEEMEKSRQIAEKANKAKSQFLATMSHEIRTPLNGIIGIAEVLSTVKYTEEEKKYLLSLQSSANSLLDTINDILDFSKIEAGKMELENTVFSLRNLVEITVNNFAYLAREKGLNLLCHIKEEVPENIFGDPVRLRQILVNLIGNSLKFTEKGSVEVKVEKLNNDANKVVLRFSVSDTGIGILSEKVDDLFNSFEQLDGSTTRKYGGTGLGLAIVKSIITIMGGTIEVQSEPGVGSIFFFEIPFQVSENSEIHDQTVLPDTDFLFENIKILLAEDNSVNQMFMQKLLEKNKLKVDIAENGKKVLEKFAENTYDLILMDIQMPEMDGCEATSAIRQIEINREKRTPIIALTANVTEDDRNRCIQCGMDDFLSKPVKFKNLMVCIKKHLEHNHCPLD